MARRNVCPLCGVKEAGLPSVMVTICDSCGTSIAEKAPRLLLVSRPGHHTFCCPDCLKKYQTVDELHSKKGSTRETEM